MNQRHIDVLTARAVTPGIAKRRGYSSIDDPDELEEYGFSVWQQKPGLLIPICLADGTVVHQLRPDDPADGPKYLWPDGEPGRLDVCPHVSADELGDADELWIVEGPLKVDALASVGAIALGILGCWGWSGPGARLDLRSLPLRGKRINIALDSDFLTHPEGDVEKAGRKLARFLSALGATPHYVEVPPGPEGSKVGPDDFLATGRTLEELQSLSVPAHSLAVQERLAQVRVYAEAQELHRAERAAAAWEPPPYVSSLQEELDRDDEPLDFTLDGLQVKGTNVELISQFKVGKSTLCLNLTQSLVDGVPFLGQFEPRKLDGRVGYWNYELSRRQFREWCRRQNIRHADRVVPLNLREHRMPIASPVVEEWTIEWLHQHEIEYWILDPWRRVIVGSAKENDNDEITTLTEVLDVIKRKAGVSDLLIPVHTPRAEMNEGEERARGGSALDDWADARWVLTKDREGKRFFRAHGRDVDVAEFQIGREPSGRLDITGGSRKEEQAHSDALEVAKVVREHPGIGYDDLYKRLEFDKNRRSVAINRALEKLKWVAWRKEGRKHAHYLTDTGKTAVKEG